ncbi:hypothetical protein JTE90_008785 [Oedothorax gibbosus]|uniref:Ionotropic receptor n=1 Tax=Oedothorax gibbosus TaxID=931172 RepID=A0AAV6V605_9ARAC|nr:hypothetical protein JTE90_008785 [Oedothorax gibbosus]
MLIAFQYLSHKRHTVEKLALHVIGVLLHQSTKLLVSCDMFLTGSWLLGCFFLSYGYMAVLLSFLTVPLSEYPLRTVAELSRAMDSGKYKCASAKGSNVLESMLESREESVRTIGRHIAKNNWFVDFRSDSEITDYLNKGKTAVITTRERMKLQFQDQFYISKDALFSSQLAIAVHKNFTHKRRLDKVIKRISAFGIYQKTIRDYLYKKKIRSGFTGESNTYIKQLTLPDLYGAFIFLGTGNLIAITIFTFELIFAKLTK